MQNYGVCLAALEGLGQVYDCGSCGNIHIQVGPVNLALEPKAYMQLVDMISTSAANFELWLQQKSSGYGLKNGSGKAGDCTRPHPAPEKNDYNEKGIQ